MSLKRCNKCANVLDLEQYLLKPSAADFIRREVIVADVISGDPQNLVGQTVYKSTDLGTSGSVSEPTDRNILIASYDYSRATGAGGDGKSQILRVNGTESTKDTYEAEVRGHTAGCLVTLPSTTTVYSVLGLNLSS